MTKGQGADVETLFTRAFGHAPPRVIRVPASLEFLGGHTEKHKGLSYSAAINLYVEIAFVPHSDGKIELVHGTELKRTKLWLHECVPGQGPNWAVPVMAVVSYLKRRGFVVNGFRAAMVNGIPNGIGLGESAAECLATALAIRQMCPFRVNESGAMEPPRMDKRGDLPPILRKERFLFAELCAGAEREFFSGYEKLYPFLAPLMAREFHLVQTDYLHTKVELHSLIGEVAIVICDSGIREPHIGLRVDQFERAASNAAEKIGLRTLRSLEPGLLNGARLKLRSREFGAAKFVMGECHRVVVGEKALQGGELLLFGDSLFQSHTAAQCFAGITCPELDVLIDLARDHPACHGARFFGAGLGGATLNLVDWTQLDSFIGNMQAGYYHATGKKLECFQVRPVDGVFD